MLQIILCEDDPKQKERIIKIVKNVNLHTNIQYYSFESTKELFEADLDLSIPTIFLMDIVLDQEDGIAMANKLRTSFHHSVVIFISAYLEKVTDIYETKHCYFIYKPELEMRIEKALNKAFSIVVSMHKQICVHSGTRQMLIHLEDIIAVERIKRYSLIYLSKETIRVNENFDELGLEINSQFHQCHRSFMINFNHVKELNRTDFITDTGFMIPISRTYSKKIQKAFQDYLVHQFY